MTARSYIQSWTILNILIHIYWLLILLTSSVKKIQDLLDWSDFPLWAPLPHVTNLRSRTHSVIQPNTLTVGQPIFSHKIYRMKLNWIEAQTDYTKSPQTSIKSNEGNTSSWNFLCLPYQISLSPPLLWGHQAFVSWAGHSPCPPF